jgi:hypothetical protein
MGRVGEFPVFRLWLSYVADMREINILQLGALGK